MVPIADKMNLTIAEAAEYRNIGEWKIRELIKKRDCDFVLTIGTKNFIKRKKFENYIANRDVI